jgi:NADH:ubiquinone reductase (H+-translocating)
MRVDERLRSISHPDVYAAGDVAVAMGSDGPIRMACQTAMPMGQYVADDIAARLAGRERVPRTVRYVWQNISLGRSDALTQFVHRDDRPRRAIMTGRAAAGFKQLIRCSTILVLRR